MRRSAPLQAPARRVQQRWLARACALAFALGLATPLAALNPERDAGDYTLQTWQTDDGLPSGRVHAVLQTRDGYLWVATARGLARFDGERFVTVDRTVHPELVHPVYHALAEAPDGALWLGTSGGLFRLHRGHVDHFTMAHGLPRNSIRELRFTRDGALFVGTTGGGTCFFRDGRATPSGPEWAQITTSVRAYLQRPDGSQLVGSGAGLWRIVGTKVEKLSERPEFPATEVSALLQRPDGTLWIGSNLGLRCVHPDGRTEDFGPAQGLTNPQVQSLLFDRDGNLWIGTQSGLFRRRGDRIERAAYAGDFRAATIQQMCEDREGTLWLATSTGLFRLKDPPFQSVGRNAGLLQASTYAVCESRDGGWWIGVLGGGVYRYTPESGAVWLEAPRELALDRVYALYEDPADGTLWIGAENGFASYRDGVFTDHLERQNAAAQRTELAATPEMILPKVIHSGVNAIAGDGAGGLWVGTNGALYRRSGDGYRAYTTAHGLPHQTIRSILRTRTDDVWVATAHGAARWRAGTFTAYTPATGLAHDGTRSVFEDRAGDIWVSTEGGGISRVKNDKWSGYTTQHGLPSDFVGGMLEDDEGFLWFGTPRGIMRLPRQDFNDLDAGKITLLRPRLFTKEDGMPGSACNLEGAPNAWKTRDGRLLFPTERGIAIVRPDDIQRSPLVPPVQIERLLVNGREIDRSAGISLAPGMSDVQIQYASISLLAPAAARFKIRLIPLDDGWRDVGSRRDVHYAKLPAGHYTFRVIAANADGIWSERGASLAFTVRPHFYQTNWFIGGMIIAVIGSAVTFGWARARLSRRQMATLSALVEERTCELKSAKEAAEAAVNAKSLLIAALQGAQEETARERARLKFIFDAVPIGLVWMREGDLDSRIINPAHARITGISLERCRERGVYDNAMHPEDRARQEKLHRRLLAGEIDRYDMEKRFVHPDGSTRWAALSVRVFRAAGSGETQEIHTLVDITERKKTEVRLAETHQKLLAISRQAGMAEVATSVLHNVGNVLNSVNVSATVLADNVRRSKVAHIAKLSALLREHEGDIATFMARDPRGVKVPAYLHTLAEHLATDQREMLHELESLRKNIDHIKDIVAMQQDYARISGVSETLPLAELVDDALRMNEVALSRHGVALVRDYRAHPTLTVDKHKVLQILINLIRNAKYACDDSGRKDKAITVQITADHGRAKVAVIDNGVGIPAENLTRIFSHGFTTRKEGHGFGLHSGALAAKELGGSLSAQSEGTGRGATFVLELPLEPPGTRPPMAGTRAPMAKELCSVEV